MALVGCCAVCVYVCVKHTEYTPLPLFFTYCHIHWSVVSISNTTQQNNKNVNCHETNCYYPYPTISVKYGNAPQWSKWLLLLSLLFWNFVFIVVVVNWKIRFFFKKKIRKNYIGINWINIKSYKCVIITQSMILSKFLLDFEMYEKSGNLLESWKPICIPNTFK